MTSFQLSNTDARLAFLALQYHLGRPGSELDAETKRPVAHGLRDVADALEPQLTQAVATVELDDRQHERLVSAVAGALNELKAYPMLGGGRGGRSVVPGFENALQRLFPEVQEDPDAASDLVAHLMTLRRQLERANPSPATSDAEPPPKRPWWRFWERG